MAHSKNAVTPLPPWQASNEFCLKVYKKVHYFSVAQGVAKLQLVKVRVVVPYRISGHSKFGTPQLCIELQECTAPF